jgi:hypothetical protein
MELQFARSVLQVIRNEWEERLTRYESSDDPEADAEMRFIDEPFVAELCLLLLVAIRHQVERELVDIAARRAFNGREISFDDYRKQLPVEREELRRRAEQLFAKLNLNSHPEWQSSMNTLRFLANCYKHDPTQEPDRALLKHLGLDLNLNYSSLSESDALREGLAKSLGLQTVGPWADPSYIAIVEAFIVKAEGFLAGVRAQPGLSPIKPERLSLNPDDFLH